MISISGSSTDQCTYYPLIALQGWFKSSLTPAVKVHEPGRRSELMYRGERRKYFLRDQWFFVVTSCWHRKACRFCFVSMMSTSSAAISVTARNISTPLG